MNRYNNICKLFTCIFFRIFFSGNYNTLKELLKNRPCDNYGNYDIALCLSAKHGHDNIVELLLSKYTNKKYAKRVLKHVPNKNAKINKIYTNL